MGVIEFAPSVRYSVPGCLIMSEAISTGSVMSAVNVSVMEKKEVELKNPQPGDGVSENEHKQEVKEIIEAEVGTDDDGDGRLRVSPVYISR